MLGGGRVEAVVELHRAPHAQIPIALENGLHALSAVHLAGFLVVHAGAKGTGNCRFWGWGAHMGAWESSGRNISVCLYSGDGRGERAMDGGSHRRVRGVDDVANRETA